MSSVAPDVIGFLWAGEGGRGVRGVQLVAANETGYMLIKV